MNNITDYEFKQFKETLIRLTDNLEKLTNQVSRLLEQQEFKKENENER